MTNSNIASDTRSKRLWDIAERVLWTALQVGLAEALIAALDMPQRWVLVLTPALSLVKTLLASKFGADSAATLPRSLDAAARPAEPGADEPKLDGGGLALPPREGEPLGYPLEQPGLNPVSRDANYGNDQVGRVDEDLPFPDERP